MELLSVLGTVLAGLGLFFVGLDFLTINIQKLTGRKFRKAVTSWTKNPVMAMGWGCFLGAVTNSSTISTFILVSLLNSGLIMVQGALPIIIGTNIGCSVLVYLASLDIKLFVLFLVGTTGILLTSEKASGQKITLSALFGVGLLFLGLNIVQSGAGTLSAEPWFRNLLEMTAQSYAIAFAVGALLCFLTQSSVAITVLSITLTKAGMLTIEQTIMIIYGAMLGSSLTTYVLSSKLRGRPRQLAMYQVAYNIIGCVVLLPLFYLEIYWHVPLVKSLLLHLSGRVDMQMAHLFFLFNTVSGVVLLMTLKPSVRLLERFWSPTAEEEEARLRYIHEHALGDPEMALDLAAMEQRRLVGFLPRYMEALRRRTAEKNAIPELRAVQNIFISVGDSVGEFLSLIGEANPPRATYERLNCIINSHRLLHFLEGSLFELAKAIDESAGKSSTAGFYGGVIEAVDMVLLTLNDAVSVNDDFTLTMLCQMTGDRGNTMQKIREAYLADDSRLAPEEKLAFLKITNICERVFWLLSSFVKGVNETYFSKKPAAASAMKED